MSKDEQQKDTTKDQFRENVSHVTSPADVVAMDELEIPDYMGLVSPLYLECVFRFTLRVWEFIQDENIDVEEYYSASKLDAEYGDKLSELASGLGISVMQFNGAASAAISLSNVGFEEWYSSLMSSRDGRVNIGDNELDRKWSMTINPSMEDHPRTQEHRVRGHVEQTLHSNGVESTIEWIDEIIEFATEESSNPEDDPEIQALKKSRTQLKNGTYEPKLVIIPE